MIKISACCAAFARWSWHTAAHIRAPMERTRGLAFKLYPQQIQHIAPGQNLVQVIRDFDTELSHCLETNVAGPQTITWAPSFLRPQMFDRALCASGQYPPPRHGQPGQRAAFLAYREDIQQTLRGMLVRTIARVEHATVLMPSQQSGVPGALCRTTTASTPIASIVLAVSIKFSP